MYSNRLECQQEIQAGRFTGFICTKTNTICTREKCRICQGKKPTEKPTEKPTKKPTLTEEAWDLSKSSIKFVADGCHTVRKDQYKERMTICDSCSSREGLRCGVCGCFIAIKGRGARGSANATSGRR